MDAPRVAHAVARALKDNGIDRIFLVTGGDLLLWQALRDHGIAMHLARSEAASVVMADAYARVTGKPAVVYGQWGPGAANVAGALADAWWAHSPLVAITSTVSTRVEYKNEYQELDQPPMFQSVTKWQARVTRADRAGELVAQAVRTAAAGCPRPVHLDIPSTRSWKSRRTPATRLPSRPRRQPRRRARWTTSSAGSPGVSGR
ncbi:thiamine pyrophosphate-binding protein [Streptomyces sp. FXJ1.4098]|nr:thiamine pyrophosphate-binding protein [Streptomyces sp. FXJ1.4098]